MTETRYSGSLLVKGAEDEPFKRTKIESLRPFRPNSGVICVRRRTTGPESTRPLFQSGNGGGSGGPLHVPGVSPVTCVLNPGTFKDDSEVLPTRTARSAKGSLSSSVKSPRNRLVCSTFRCI